MSLNEKSEKPCWKFDIHNNTDKGILSHHYQQIEE